MNYPLFKGKSPPTSNIKARSRVMGIVSDRRLATLSKVSRLMSLLQLVSQSFSQPTRERGTEALTLPHKNPICTALQGATGEIVSGQHHRDRRHRIGWRRRGRRRGRWQQPGAVAAGRALALRERGARAAVPVQLHAVVLDLGRRPPDRLRLPHLRLLRLARGRGGHFQKGKTDMAIKKLCALPI